MNPKKTKVLVVNRSRTVNPLMATWSCLVLPTSRPTLFPWHSRCKAWLQIHPWGSCERCCVTCVTWELFWGLCVEFMKTYMRCLVVTTPSSFISSSTIPLFVGLLPTLLCIVYTLSGRIGKVVTSHAAAARWIPAEVALIYNMHAPLRGYCPWGWGVRPVNWIYRLWGYCT